LKKLALLVGVVFALLLFGCLGSTGAQAATATPGAAATVSAATATPSATPIGQIQQTATPTTVAASFNLEAVKANVEAAVVKMYPNLAPFSLDQYDDNMFGIYYKKETSSKEKDMTVGYSFIVRRTTADELRPASAAKYPQQLFVGDETVYYEILYDGTAAQVSRGSIACVANGVNKGFVLFEISNKPMASAEVRAVFAELVSAC